MSRAAVSSLVYGIYLIGLGLTLFIIPDVAATLVGLEPHKDVWLYISAMTILVQSVYFIVSAPLCRCAIWSRSSSPRSPRSA